jgi:type IV pilus assembly protein PilB
MSAEITHITPEIKQIISTRQAWNYRIIPKEITTDSIHLYIDTKVINDGITNELEILLGKRILLTPLDGEKINEALKTYYSVHGSVAPGLMFSKIIGDKDTLVLRLVIEALTCGCSDIHFEAQERNARIRYRSDGHLIDKYYIEKSEYPALINAIKIKANLDISEKRLPQDGRILYSENNLKLDIRVSVIPTINGEKIVFRLLNKDTSHIELENLGFSPVQMNQYRNGIAQSHGLVLISGPTGSGKTTTLYATLKTLNTQDKNILTIEDPIEYTLEGINQVQLKEAIGLSFPSALRTFLRQDPDIIMVGEIRDNETAQIAIRAALTGHLVLSTIHTNSALGIIPRLTDMGIPGYLISGTLNIAVAQRLIRLLCQDCKIKTDDKDILIEQFFQEKKSDFYKARGCDKCLFTGYRGRKAIFEVIEIDTIIKEKIRSNPYDINNIIKQRKIVSLVDQVRELFITGQTSIEEILPLLLTG